MITDAIQSILDPLVNSYSPIIESDNLPEGVFAVHQEFILDTLKDKEEIYGFIYDVAVTVVSDSQEELDLAINTLTEEIIEAQGDISGTIFEEVELKSTQGVTWDDEKKKYYDKITFTVQTKNR